MPEDQPDVRPEDAVQIAQRALAKTAEIQQDCDAIESELDELEAELEEIDRLLDGDSDE